MSSPQIVLSPLPTSKQFTRRILTVNNPMIVGRSTALQLKSLENSLFESPIISRNHGIFSFKNGRFYYLDNHSPNGSFLNGNKVKPGEETQLREEDSLMLGNQEDNDKIVAKIILRYPFLGESLIPSWMLWRSQTLTRPAALTTLLLCWRPTNRELHTRRPPWRR